MAKKRMLSFDVLFDSVSKIYYLPICMQSIIMQSI